jgi:hypothetical protein
MNKNYHLEEDLITRLDKEIAVYQDRIEVIQAFIDGKPIEIRIRNDETNPWVRCRTPLWYWNDFEYRVAVNVPAPCEGKIIEVDGKKYKLTSV